MRPRERLTRLGSLALAPALLRAPGTPTAAGSVALLFPDPAAAASAAVVDARLGEAGVLAPSMPYRTRFPARTIARSSDAPLLTIALETGAEGIPDRVVRLLLQRDLLFIAWDE